MQPIGLLWIKTAIAPPPEGQWFFGRYVDATGNKPDGEVMPTYIFPQGPCLSVRWTSENQLAVLQHTLALPPEWRP